MAAENLVWGKDAELLMHPGGWSSQWHVSLEAALAGLSLSAHHDGKPSCLGSEEALGKVSWMISLWWACSPMVDLSFSFAQWLPRT